ncbi:hypothetical protein F4774DRAFT_388289 [Daldinia eschscholtzii]|nr:hypothetical protein F4774DRAFT_388289 [Daldinia eschscholtzii]
MAETDTTSNPMGDNTQKAVLPPPDWLKTWRRRFHGQRWGFVAFRTTYFSDDNGDERWNKFKEKFERIVQLPFARDIAHAQERGLLLPDDFEEARAKFVVQWVDDREIAIRPISADSLRAKYAAMRPSLDAALSWEIFLCASPEAVKSFEEEAANTDETSKFWRPRAPFMLAVVAHGDSGLEEDHEEAAWFKPVFKVAAEVSAESLFAVLDMGTSIPRVTRLVRRATELDPGLKHGPLEETRELDEMWWSMHLSPTRMRNRMRITRGIIVDE